MAFQERWERVDLQPLEAVDFELLLLGQVNLQRGKKKKSKRLDK